MPPGRPRRNVDQVLEQVESELDRLDPAPAPPRPPRPPRRPARRRGQVELAVARDLSRLPDDLRKGGIAVTALRLARELDTAILGARDAQGHAREIRLALMTLHELAPGERKGDGTDEVRARRERRLAAGE